MGSAMGLWGPGWRGVPVIGEKHALNISQGLQRALAMFQLFLGQTLCVQELLGQLLLLLLRSQACSTRASTWSSFTRCRRVEACLRLGDRGLVNWRTGVARATAGKIFGFHACSG